jgi:hypothetical protein
MLAGKGTEGDSTLLVTDKDIHPLPTALFSACEERGTASNRAGNGGKQIFAGVVDSGDKHKVANISANFCKHSIRSHWDIQGPGGN